METLVVMVIAIWAIRRLIVDAAYAIRGQVPPTLARRGPRRPGFRTYFAEVWSDAWASASARHKARLARRAAGQPRYPRLARLAAKYRSKRDAFRAWWRAAAGGRQLQRRGNTLVDRPLESAWDRAWRRAEQRYGARPPDRRATPNSPTTQPEDLDDSPPSSPAGTPPAEPVEPAHSPPRAAPPAVSPPQPTGPPPAPVGEPGRQPPPPNEHTERGNHVNGEITGLSTAISFAASAEEANNGAATEWENAIASLEAGEVSGPVIAAATTAMEAQQQAAAAAAEARAALERHTQVREAYEANPDAGNRDFVTSE